jgi:tripartite-type tricarboxylate transporter receptor subunit TctC
VVSLDDRLRRRALGQGAGLVLAPWLAASARAQGKPLTLLVGYNPGGPVDIVARQLAPPLAELLGRQVIVDYRPGAGGQFALTALKQAPADGQLLALSPPSPLTIFPSTFARLAYEPFKDFAPIATACTFDFALVVGAGHPAKTLAEFAAWCKANPRQASLGVAGLGTTPHFLGWTYARKVGIELEAIPYKGTPQMAQEVAGGQIACAISPQANFAELIKGGKLRLLATTGPQRSTVFPQTPTFNESGMAELQSEEWFALFARAGTPQPLLDTLADAMRRIGARDAYRKALAEMGFNPQIHDATRLARDIQADHARWAEVVRRTGFKAEG